LSTVTPNFNWPVPTSTDLVKDGATAIEALGDSIDASMVDLKGGTSGQILSKNSNTDMDFVWIANDQGDITGVTATSPITGGGTSGAITIGILSGTTSNLGAVQLSTSTSSTSTSLAATASAVKEAYDPAFTNNFYAGKNKVINAAFNVWQRGTSNTVPIANNSYSGPDRFQFSRNGSGSVVTVSRQAFTPGAAPVAGYEGNYFMRFNQTTAGTGGSYNEIQTRLEDVTTFAGQTVTFSFWAKADSSRTLSGALSFYQNFGSGGSTQVSTSITLNSYALTTAWTRYTGTVSLPSISGKTIGTSSYLEIDMQLFMNTTFTFDTWGWQVEAGSSATPFQTSTGTVQGELAACQRYYQVIGSGAAGGADLADRVAVGSSFLVSMRSVPTLALVGQVSVRQRNGITTATSPTVVTYYRSTTGYTAVLDGFAGLTAGSGLVVAGDTASNGNNTFTLSAEL
jgi:hypothetical protein